MNPDAFPWLENDTRTANAPSMDIDPEECRPMPTRKQKHKANLDALRARAARKAQRKARHAVGAGVTKGGRA